MSRPLGQHGEDVKETEEWEAGKNAPTGHHDELQGQHEGADGTPETDPAPQP